MSSDDYARLLLPTTGSPLFNFSLALNSSLDPRDTQYTDPTNFGFWGYPSDTFAVYFMRKSPGFIITLQLIVVSMIVCFSLMSGVLAYYTFVSPED